jgi:hypothetical protein
MNPFGIEPWIVMEVSHQHDELIESIEMERFLKKTFRNEGIKTHRVSKILALIGRELAGFGAILEDRYSIQPDQGRTF